MRRRLGDNVDRFKWVAGGLLALLRDDDRPASLQGSDLPIDVQHLRFKKRRAITSDDRDIYLRISNFEFRIYQKLISKNLIPFHLPGMLGSNDVLSTHVPYRAGAHGFSIWSGLRVLPNPRGTTPCTSGRCKSGGGVGIARTGCCGPIGARKLCAKALVTSAASIEMINVFIIFSFPARRASSCP